MQPSMTKLEKEFRLSGDVLKAAVLRKPAVLGCNVDCSGDCIAECNRCWARF